jgi:ribosomal protein S18 acetylase RimI-like enzyme
VTPAPTIVRLEEGLIPQAADLLARSFFRDPLFTYAFPDEGERAKLLPGHFAAHVRHGHLFGEVFTTAGAVAGVSLWLPPGRTEVTSHQQHQSGLDKLRTLFGLQTRERLALISSFFEDIHHATVPDDHWYLWMIGVDPVHQGKGIGSALINPVLVRADRDGIPCYLETVERRNVPFYTRLGFTIAREGVEPSSGAPYWIFVRPSLSR